MHVLRGGRAGKERWLGLVVLPLLLGSLVLSAACGDDTSDTGEAGEYSAAGGATAPAPGEAGELGGPGGAGGGSTEVPPNAAPGEAGELGGPGGDSDPPDAGPGEAGDYGGPGGPTTTISFPPGGVDDGHIWTPDCDAYVTARLEAGQYAELRGDLECILNDPTAAPDVLEAAREADALAQGRLAGRETDSGTTSPPEPDSDSAG